MSNSCYPKCGIGIPHKDFRGAPLHVGDRVAYNATQQGTFLRVAIVQGYTPERLLIP